MNVKKIWVLVLLLIVSLVSPAEAGIRETLTSTVDIPLEGSIYLRNKSQKNLITKVLFSIPLGITASVLAPTRNVLDPKMRLAIFRDEE